MCKNECANLENCFRLKTSKCPKHCKHTNTVMFLFEHSNHHKIDHTRAFYLFNYLFIFLLSWPFLTFFFLLDRCCWPETASQSLVVGFTHHFSVVWVCSATSVFFFFCFHSPRRGRTSSASLLFKHTIVFLFLFVAYIYFKFVTPESHLSTVFFHHHYINFFNTIKCVCHLL